MRTRHALQVEQARSHLLSVEVCSASIISYFLISRVVIRWGVYCVAVAARLFIIAGLAECSSFCRRYTSRCLTFIECCITARYSNMAPSGKRADIFGSERGARWQKRRRAARRTREGAGATRLRVRTSRKVQILMFFVCFPSFVLAVRPPARPSCYDQIAVLTVVFSISSSFDPFFMSYLGHSSESNHIRPCSIQSHAPIPTLLGQLAFPTWLRKSRTPFLHQRFASHRRLGFFLSLGQGVE